MGRPFDPRNLPNRGRARRGGPRRGARWSYFETLAVLSIVTFLVVFQTDIGGRGHAPAELLRERPAVAVSRPFSGCREARAAGAAPVYRGDPGYGPHLDGDGDGVGCEPYRGY